MAKLASPCNTFNKVCPFRCRWNRVIFLYNMLWWCRSSKKKKIIYFGNSFATTSTWSRDLFWFASPSNSCNVLIEPRFLSFEFFFCTPLHKTNLLTFYASSFSSICFSTFFFCIFPISFQQWWQDLRQYQKYFPMARLKDWFAKAP